MWIFSDGRERWIFSGGEGDRFFGGGVNFWKGREWAGVSIFLPGGRPSPGSPFSHGVVCFHFVLFQSSVIDDTD